MNLPGKTNVALSPIPSASNTYEEARLIKCNLGGYDLYWLPLKIVFILSVLKARDHVPLLI